MSVRIIIIVGLFLMWLPGYGEANAFHGPIPRLKHRIRADNVRLPIVHRNNYAMRSDGRRLVDHRPSINNPAWKPNRTAEERARDRNRLTYPPTDVTTRTTTTLKGPPYIMPECDYLIFYCMKAFTTSYICARSIYFTYWTFKDYCYLDHINCQYQYKVWNMVHMGICFNTYRTTNAGDYPRYDLGYLNNTYAEGDGDRIRVN